jgi:hypothetical protein
MNEKTDAVVGEVEHARTNESTQQRHDFNYDGNVKTSNVFSVPLTDALAKDNPSPWALHMWKLYGIMIIVTLSMFPFVRTVSFHLHLRN